MAEKLTHSPGPWFLEGNWSPEAEAELGGWVSCFPPAGMPIFELTPVVGGREEICANARLIAAAPDLLEALSRLVEVCEKQPRISKAYPEPNSPLGMARAAIAKATGRSTLAGGSDA